MKAINFSHRNITLLASSFPFFSASPAGSRRIAEGESHPFRPLCDVVGVPVIGTRCPPDVLRRPQGRRMTFCHVTHAASWVVVIGDVTSYGHYSSSPQAPAGQPGRRCSCWTSLPRGSAVAKCSQCSNSVVRASTLLSACLVFYSAWIKPIFGIISNFTEISVADWAWIAKLMKQGVALTGRNRTGPPCSVGRPTAHAPDGRCADRPRARRPAGPPAGSVTDDDVRQTPVSKTILAH